MPHTRLHARSISSRVVLTIVFLFSLALVRADLDTIVPAPGQSSDEAALRSLVEKLYAAYAREDLKSFIGLWSDKAAGLDARSQALEQLFALEDSSFSNITISRINIKRDRASLRVIADLNAVSAQTRETRKERLLRSLTFVKEGDQWKLWSDEPAVAEFAAALTEANTDKERAALLADEKDLLTDELRQTLAGKAEGFLSRQDYTRAVGLYAVALAIAEQLKNDSAVAASLMGLGNAHRLQGSYAAALDYYRKALAHFQSADDKSGVAVALDQIGTIYHAQGNYATALESYQKVLAYYEEMGNTGAIASALDSLGSVYYDQGSYKLALQFFERGLEMRRVMNDKESIAATHNNIGTVHYKEGNYAAALEHYRKALALFEAINAKSIEVAATLRNIGSAHYSQGNYDLALDRYLKSLALDEELGYKDGLAGALSDIGLVQSSQGNFGLALEYYFKSLKLREEMRDKVGTAAALHNIGMTLNYQGNYAAALERYEQSLRLEEELANKPHIAMIENNIGGIHYAQGNYPAALEHFHKALAQFQSVGDRQAVAAALSSIGNVNHLQRSHNQAMDYYQKSLAAYEALQDEAGVASVLDKIASINYAQGDYRKAMEFAGRAIAVAKRIDLGDTLWRARFTAGSAYRSLGQPDQARQNFEEAIATVETMRAHAPIAEQSHRFFQDKASPYLAMVELLVNENKAGEALTYAERIKSHALRDALESGRVSITKGMNAAEREQERGLSNRLISLGAQIRHAKQSKPPDDARLGDLVSRRQKAAAELQAFRARLYRAHPQLRAYRGEAPPLSPDEAALLSDPKNALLEFVVTEGKTYLFALTRPASNRKSEIAPTLKVFTLEINRKELAERVARFREDVAERKEGFQPSAREMYKLLLEPARSELEGKAALVVIPDATLWRLPFQALQPAENRFLIEDCSLLYAPSLTALREMRKARRGWSPVAATANHLLAFANPALAKETVERIKLVNKDARLESLSHAEREARSLERLYGPRRSRVYTGTQAREERARSEAASFKVLHFAAPGTLDDASPMYSHVALYSGESANKDDGLLEAWELLRMNLTADVATFSRTSSKQAGPRAGDGAIGLAWAIFVAGCRATVMSHWAVDSASTTELVAEFHGSFSSQISDSRGSRSTARSLQQAAIKLIRSGQYRHPHYWAGFQAMGA